MIIVLDFETYYDQDISLSKMSTSEYVRHEDFKVHMVGVKEGEAPTRIMDESEFLEWAKGVDWPNAELVCHHTAFDGFILAERYGIIPGTYRCTLSMARAALPGLSKYTLEVVAAALGLPGKIEGELVKSKGVRTLSPEQFHALGLYCAQDIEATYGVYTRLIAHFTASELKLIDLTLRMFCEPVLKVDIARVTEELSKEMGSKMAALFKSGVQASEIISNPKFAKLLEGYGVSPPIKVSALTGKPTFAFAKNDQGLRALLHHTDDRVKAVVEARIKLKSSIGETRARRFLEEGKDGASLPIYLHYYGAHTGRWSGGNKINMQNLPRGGELRKSILAPEGQVLVVVDSGQIEARVTAWFAEEKSLLSGFAGMTSEGDTDIYTKFAQEVYDKPVTKANKIERFVGKTCISEGSMVLSNSGWKPIEAITLADKVWDGEEWVCHKGVVCNGWKQTLELSGLWLTPDHQVWCGTQWKEAQYLEQDENILSQALDFAAGSLPLRGTSKELGKALLPLLSNVIADSQNIQSTGTALRTSSQLDVAHVLERRHLKSATGNMPKLCQTMDIGRGFLTAWRQLSHAATFPHVKFINTTVGEVYEFISSGSTIEQSSSNTYKHYRGGINQNSKWIERMLMGAMSLGTYNSLQSKRTFKTNVRSQILRRKLRVYDILSAGQRHRFTVKTDSGPLIVHNCILGLGFGMGADRLRATLLAAQTPVDLPFEQCRRIVNLYRGKYRNIVALWRRMDRVIDDMSVGRAGEYKCISWAKNRVLKPSNMFLYYKGLRKDAQGRWEYEPGRNMKVNIYGGLLTENVVQGTARDIVAEQMLNISTRYRVVMMSHDEVVFLAPRTEADSALTWALKIMSAAPTWAQDIPLTAEGGSDVCYSK